MSDCKELLLNNIIKNLIASGFNPDNVGKIQNILIINLDEYEISLKCTDLMIPDSESEKIIKIYVGTILSEGKRRATAKTYEKFLLRFWNDINKPLIEVNTFDLRLWIARKKESVSLRTINTYCNYLSSFYGWLFKEEIIRKNPYEKIKTIPVKKSIKFPFTETEIDNMRFACNTVRDRAILELLLSSGIRIAELCSLNIQDIDLVKKEVRVYDGKGGKQRITYMNDLAARYLNEYLLSRKDNIECLFLSKKKNRVSKSTIAKMMRETGYRANVKNAHAHKCRRTFATTLYHRGADIKTIQILMGHESVETTMGYIYSDMGQIENKYKECY